MIGAMLAFMPAVSLGDSIWLKCDVVDPFSRLRDFAEKIAAGDPDTLFAMDRGNIFGASSGRS